MAEINLPGEKYTEVVTGRLRMTADRILLKPLDWNAHADVSEILIAVRRGNAVRGEVIEVGPGLYPIVKRRMASDGKSQRVDYSPHFRPTEVKPGDIVELGGLNIFDGSGYSFPQVNVNGEQHLIVTERDVAIVRDDLS